MKTPKRRHTRTEQTDGCRDSRRPSPEARARHADAMAQAMLRQMHARF
jgi:hypothetical protein